MLVTFNRTRSIRHPRTCPEGTFLKPLSKKAVSFFRKLGGMDPRDKPEDDEKDDFIPH